MAIVPLLLNMARELESDYRGMGGDMENFLDDDFGFGIHPIDIFRPRGNQATLMHPRRRHVPYDRTNMLARRAAARLGKTEKDGAGLPTLGKDGFQLCMDVTQFKPSELTVKTVDNTIVIEGKHEEREDNYGMVQRHFVRKYTLPKDYDPKDVVSTISSDGVLTVKAPLPPSEAIKQNERVVQIQQTGPAHLSVKAPEPEKEGGKAQNGATEKMETK